MRYGATKNNQSFEKQQVYVPQEKPMTYDAWTQTDATFCKKYDPIASTYPSSTEMKLMEMLESLQEQLSIQTNYLHSLQQNQFQNSVKTTSTHVQEPSSNYRIIANGVLEPVEVEEITSELMQVQTQMGSEHDESKVYGNYDVKPIVAVTPNQKIPKILNFHKPLPAPEQEQHYIPPPSNHNSPAHDSSMDMDTSYYNSSDLGNVHVSIGPNNTRIPAKIFDSIKWESASIATRKLLTTVFDRSTLATHTMTGKPSPAFKDSGKPHKQMLDQNKIKDIIFAVSRKSGVSEKEVRNVITTKCADENKMHRTKEKKRLSLIESDKENVFN